MTRSRPLRALALATVLAAAAAAPARTAPLTAAPAQTHARMRLPAGVRPLAADVALRIDPAQPVHTGQVRLTLALQHPARSIELHARELELRSAVADLGVHQLAARVRRLDPERVVLQFASTVPTGRVQLRIDFQGTLQSREAYGLFRRRSGGQWYAATQFEPTGARLAFPALDEPGWKLPWRLTLTVPQALLAVANTPVRRESPVEPGWKQVEFEPTAPLPSYLVAFAVGPYDVYDAPPAQAVPVRFVTPAGQAPQAAWSAGVTAGIVQRLEAYFGLPYPYTKLDSLALPVPTGFGAMENAGLLTYAAPLVLAPPGEDTQDFRRGYVALAAHELAHQWFGNLVTMRWWDDLWLNESFASWMGDRIAAEFDPSWRLDTAVHQARQRAMRIDQRPSTRRVREPVRTDDDLGSMWDPITYEKGEVLLAMVEQWLGPQHMREAMRRYIGRHAWGHADADDLLRVLGEADARVPAVVRGYVDRAGVPEVHVALRCDDGAAPRLLLRQAAWRAAGDPPPRAGSTDAIWRIPMAIRTPHGLTRTVLDGAQSELTLPDRACPAWVQANAGGLGYYRTAYDAPLWRALWQRPAPEVGETLSDLDDALARSQAGALRATELLPLVRQHARSTDRRIVEAAATLLLRLGPVLHAADEAAYAAAWQEAFGERARTLGWQPRADDDDDARLLRTLLVPALAEHGRDATLRTQALELARAWLAGTTVLSSDLRPPALATAALAADAAAAEMFDRMAERAQRSDDPAEQAALYAALGRFRAPELARRARALLLRPTTDLQVALPGIMSGQAKDDDTREPALQFLAANRARLGARVGRDEAAHWPWYFAEACAADDARRIEASFAPAAAEVQGGRRQLAQALEGVRMCAAWRRSSG